MGWRRHDQWVGEVLFGQTVVHTTSALPEPTEAARVAKQDFAQRVINLVGQGHGVVPSEEGTDLPHGFSLLGRPIQAMFPAWSTFHTRSRTWSTTMASWRDPRVLVRVV